MALADIEGAQIHLKQLVIAHQLASWESIQVILIRHYNRQFLHEMYKVCYELLTFGLGLITFWNIVIRR